jgi:hypothetical protein
MAFHLLGLDFDGLLCIWYRGQKAAKELYLLKLPAVIKMPSITATKYSQRWDWLTAIFVCTDIVKTRFYSLSVQTAEMGLDLFML